MKPNTERKDHLQQRSFGFSPNRAGSLNSKGSLNTSIKILLFPTAFPSLGIESSEEDHHEDLKFEGSNGSTPAMRIIFAKPAIRGIDTAFA